MPLRMECGSENGRMKTFPPCFFRRGPGQSYFDLVKQLGPNPAPLRSTVSSAARGLGVNGVGACHDGHPVHTPCPSCGLVGPSGNDDATPSQQQAVDSYQNVDHLMGGKPSEGQNKEGAVRAPISSQVWGEQVIVFNTNAEAESSEHFDVGAMVVSPGGHLVAVTVDLVGDER